MTLTTSTGVTYVMGIGCTSCIGTRCVCKIRELMAITHSSRRYDSASSPTMEMKDRGTNIDFLGGTANSDIVSENCSLPLDDGSVWVFAKQTRAVSITYRLRRLLIDTPSGRPCPVPLQ